MTVDSPLVYYHTLKGVKAGTTTMTECQSADTLQPSQLISIWDRTKNFHWSRALTMIRHTSKIPRCDHPAAFRVEQYRESQGTLHQIGEKLAISRQDGTVLAR
jgi:hypothetical protein